MSDPLKFVLQGKDAKATGYPTEDGKFVVLANSLAHKEIVASARNLPKIRQELSDAGIFIEENGVLRVTQDYTFESPSGAAAAMLGRTANGWVEWRLPDGRSLSDVRRVKRSSAHVLDESQRLDLQEKYDELVNASKLPSSLELEVAYRAFREHFGPQVLSGLDGVELLERLHDHGSKASLVHWLEYKSDDEFDTKQFGSIAGGSALKFRVFRRKETGNWQAANNRGKPADISVDDAIKMARSHRDQLIAGVEVLDAFSTDASDEDYAQLQDQFDEAAPDVSRLAWGHKYFSLMFPDKLDDFHSPEWQRFHIIKLLQLPPEGNGRYICAGRFIAGAKELGISVNHFTGTLNAAHGSLHRYWRVGTTSGRSGESFWEMMRDRSCISVGWPDMGNLDWVNSSKRDELRQKLEEVYPNTPAAIGNACSQITHFVSGISEGDIVCAADGQTILGIGRVIGEYYYDPAFGFPNHRDVEWLSLEEWTLPHKEGMQSTVRQLGKHDENLVAVEQRIRGKKPIVVRAESNKQTSQNTRLSGIPGRIQSVLERKSQVILYGPPGTGKTYWAEKAAFDLASLSAFGVPFDSLDDARRIEVTGTDDKAGSVRFCCFHPAYGYEDFLEGYRPQTKNEQITFELRDGVFKQLCRDAYNAPQRKFYLIIDEINRGDIPRIFGELLTTLEKDKRGKNVVLPLSQQPFAVPKNVFVIGTMNTADRSVSLLDAALRRRFGFIEMMPDSSVLSDWEVGGIPLRAWLDAINEKIRKHVGRDSRNLQIGHSYLMQGGNPIKELASLRRAIRDDIVPLLEEYCYEDYRTLETILGKGLVDVEMQCVRSEPFNDGQDDLFVAALLSPHENIGATSEALSAEQSQEDMDEPDADDDSDEATL